MGYVKKKVGWVYLKLQKNKGENMGFLKLEKGKNTLEFRSKKDEN